MSSHEIDQAFIETVTRDAEEVWTKDFESIEEMFNRCCFSIAVDVVRRLDLFQNIGDIESPASLGEKIKIFEDARYVFDKLLTILAEEKVIEADGANWRCLENEPDIETPAEALVMAVRKHPGEGASYQWLARAHDGLVRYISGKAFSEEVMFPWGSFKLVEEVYNTSDIYGFYSRLAGRTIKRIIETQFDDKVTMLEIGAGTGNGTRNVLSETNESFEKYIFTDVSKSLVQLGRRRLKKLGHDFIDYRTLDIGQDITAQDFPEECADVVLAVNVLHATDDIDAALAMARRLVRPGGWFVLSEIAPPEGGLYRYMDLTFGLLPSYSKYSDHDVRPLAPIIRPDEWRAALERVGFSETAAVPGDRLEGVDRGGVVLARR
jgi:ubiquinone/menaquinone biosynthesis C-methylase UbiE